MSKEAKSRKKRTLTPRVQLIQPRCKACRKPWPTPYKRKYHKSFEVWYCKCECGQNLNIDVF